MELIKIIYVALTQHSCYHIRNHLTEQIRINLPAIVVGKVILYHLTTCKSASLFQAN